MDRPDPKFLIRSTDIKANRRPHLNLSQLYNLSKQVPFFEFKYVSE